MEPQIQYAKTSDGVSIAFWTMGEGSTPLVILSPLLFGHLTRELEVPQIRSWYDRLAEERLVIRFDRRNQGLSQRGVPPSSAGHDVGGVMDVLQLEHAHLLGFYGPAAEMVRYAAQRPDRVSRLALWAPLATARWVRDRRYQTLVALADRDWELFVETFAHTYLGWWRGSSAHWWAKLIRDSVAQADFLASMKHLGEGPGVTDILPLVQAPTLVLHQPGMYGGTEDEESRLVASSVPNARLVQLEQRFVGPHFSEVGMEALRAFLAGDETPPGATVPSGLTVILFADIAGSTALTERLGDAAFRKKARALDAALRQAITERNGTPIEGKLLGDGVLATFASARDAIEGALACAQAGDGAGLPLHLGLHAGDVIREENNVFGGAVNIAARVAAAAGPGETLVSQTVRDLARTSAGVSFEDRGERELKGIEEPLRVFAVRHAE
jgi:class 3 adenylate cyclase